MVLNEDQGKEKRLRNILTIISESYSQMHGRKIIVLPFENTPAIASSKRRWEVGIARSASSLGSQLVFVTFCTVIPGKGLKFR